MTVIGHKDTIEDRRMKWHKLLESKRSYNHFSKCSTEQELSIAKVDKDIYNYYLNSYVA
jgi:hypothetical protein